MFDETDRSLKTRRGSLHQIAGARLGLRLEHACQATTYLDAVLGAHAVPGCAIRAINPDLNQGALRRAAQMEVDQLESHGGDVAADRVEQRVGRHQGLEKKCGGTPPLVLRPPLGDPRTAA